MVTSNNVGVFSVISLWIASAFDNIWLHRSSTEVALGTAFLCAFIDTDKHGQFCRFFAIGLCADL